VIHETGLVPKDRAREQVALGCSKRVGVCRHSNDGIPPFF